MTPRPRRWYHCDDCGCVWSLGASSVLILGWRLPPCPECASLNVERGLQHAS